MSKQEIANIIGYIAAANISIVQVPQLWKTFREKDASGLSSTMIILNILGGLLWTTYGILLNLPPIYGANVMFLSVNGSLLILKNRYRSRVSNVDTISE